MNELTRPDAYAAGHTVRCRRRNVVGWHMTHDVVYIACRGCGSWTLHLTEQARGATRVVPRPAASEIDWASAARVAEEERREREAEVPRRPAPMPGHVRHGATRKAA